MFTNSTSIFSVGPKTVPNVTLTSPPSLRPSPFAFTFEPIEIFMLPPETSTNLIAVSTGTT